MRTDGRATGKVFFMRENVLLLFRRKRNGGQTNDQIEVIRLHFGVIGGFVARYSAALIAFLIQNVSAFGIRFGVDRAHNAAAWIPAISGHNVHMER